MPLINPINFLKKKYRIFVACFFTLIGFYLRFKALAGRDLWVDELNQLANISGPFKPIWKRLPLGELTCFPGEYLLNYPFVRLFGDNKWLINIPHYFITLLGFYFLYLICKKHLKTFWGFTVAFIVFCFNQHLIFHAFEFRPYAVLPTLSLALFYYSEIVIDGWKGLKPLNKFLVGIFFIFAVIYHVYGIVVAGLSLLYFAIIKINKSSFKEALKGLKTFLAPIGITGILLFIWCASGTIVNPQHCQARNINTLDFYPNPLGDFIHFIRQLFFNLMGQKHYGEKHLALGIWIAFLIPHKDRLKQVGFFLLMIILPIMLILTSDLYSGYWFLDRQFVWVMSLYAFFIGYCWDTISIFLQEKIKNAPYPKKGLERKNTKNGKK